MDMHTRSPFKSPLWTASGDHRAMVAPTRLRTLWFNTGTLCNLTCANCYIESSPRNDALIYLDLETVDRFLDELSEFSSDTEEIGFTGGEPCMNPDLPEMLESALRRGYRVLLLTNAMRPMMKQGEELAALNARYGERLEVRVSVDHFNPAMHEEERGAKSWRPMADGLAWLAQSGFNLSVAGRTRWGESEARLREGFAELFDSLGVPIDTMDSRALVLFPEMDPAASVPEITTECWNVLGKAPGQQMCAESRMVIHRRGRPRATVVACTLIAYETGFELGETLRESMRPVLLNHPHCARFCVLGGASCSERN